MDFMAVSPKSDFMAVRLKSMARALSIPENVKDCTPGRFGAIHLNDISHWLADRYYDYHEKNSIKLKAENKEDKEFQLIKFKVEQLDAMARAVVAKLNTYVRTRQGFPDVVEVNIKVDRKDRTLMIRQGGHYVETWLKDAPGETEFLKDEDHASLLQRLEAREHERKMKELAQKDLDSCSSSEHDGYVYHIDYFDSSDIESIYQDEMSATESAQEDYESSSPVPLKEALFSWFHCAEWMLPIGKSYERRAAILKTASSEGRGEDSRVSYTPPQSVLGLATKSIDISPPKDTSEEAASMSLDTRSSESKDSDPMSLETSASRSCLISEKAFSTPIEIPSSSVNKNGEQGTMPLSAPLRSGCRNSMSLDSDSKSRDSMSIDDAATTSESRSSTPLCSPMKKKSPMRVDGGTSSSETSISSNRDSTPIDIPSSSGNKNEEQGPMSLDTPSTRSRDSLSLGSRSRSRDSMSFESYSSYDDEIKIWRHSFESYGYFG